MSIGGNQNSGQSQSGPPATPPGLWRALIQKLRPWWVTCLTLVIGPFIANDVFAFLALVVVGVVIDRGLTRRNRIVDIREEIRRLGPNGMARRYTVCTFLCRYYVATIFGVMALLGAENWLSGTALFLLGLLVDAVRARHAPDLSTDMQQIEIAISTPSAMNIGRRRQWLVQVVLVAGFLAYMSALLFVATPSHPDRLSGLLILFTPLHEIAVLFLESARHVPSQLESAGFRDGALLAVHIFSVAWLFILISGMHGLVVSYQVLLGNLRAAKNEPEAETYNWSITHLLFCFVVALFFYWPAFHLASVDFIPTRTKGSFHVSLSNGPYVWVVFASIAASWALRTAYFYLLKMRYQLWLAMREQRLPATTSPADRDISPLT